MTRCLEAAGLALAVVLWGCGSESTHEGPAAPSEQPEPGDSATESSGLPEVRYYVIADI